MGSIFAMATRQRTAFSSVTHNRMSGKLPAVCLAKNFCNLNMAILAKN